MIYQSVHYNNNTGDAYVSANFGQVVLQSIGLFY